MRNGASVFAAWKTGEAFAPCLRAFGVVGVEKLGQEGDAFRIVHGSEVGRAAEVDDRLDTARVIRERVVRVIACIFHPEQRGELPTGGVAEGSDVIGTLPCWCVSSARHAARRRAEPAMSSCRPHEAIVDGEGDIAVTCKEVAHALHGAFVKAGPAAAMDEQDGARRRGCLDGFVNIDWR